MQIDLSQNVWVMTDIHGCANTFKALLTQLPIDEPKFCLGDLVDRGPDSCGVIDLARKYNVQCLLGNHEVMLLDVLVHQNFSMHLWGKNGGDAALASYPNGIVSRDHIDWLLTLPTHFEFLNLKNEEGKCLFLSHSAYHAGFRGESPDLIPLNNDYSIVWNRVKVQPSKTRYFIRGHTPVLKPQINKDFANIDTGCAYHGAPIDDYSTGQKRRTKFQGFLTALSFPDMNVVQQLCLDEVRT